MSKTYIPEAGQACFGNPYSELECPEYIVAMIEYLADLASMVEWNRAQDEGAFGLPTQNTGGRWSNDTFELRSFYWGDDEAEADKPNFRCGDIEVRWYKHVRRGTTINRDVTPAEAVAMFERCAASLDRDLHESIDEDVRW